MAESLSRSLRGLLLSATELRSLTDWPDSLVEDYLTLFENLIKLATEIDTKSGILVETGRITTTP